MAITDQVYGVTETLDQTAAKATDVASTVYGLRQSLAPMIDALTGQWEGTARPVFQEAHAVWNDGMSRLCFALEDLSNNTTFAAAEYTAGDECARTGLSGVLREA